MRLRWYELGGESNGDRAGEKVGDVAAVANKPRRIRTIKCFASDNYEPYVVLRYE